MNCELETKETNVLGANNEDKTNSESAASVTIFQWSKHTHINHF